MLVLDPNILVVQLKSSSVLLWSPLQMSVGKALDKPGGKLSSRADESLEVLLKLFDNRFSGQEADKNWSLVLINPGDLT